MSQAKQLLNLGTNIFSLFSESQSVKNSLVSNLLYLQIPREQFILVWFSIYVRDSFKCFLFAIASVGSVKNSLVSNLLYLQIPREQFILVWFSIYVRDSFKCFLFATASVGVINEDVIFWGSKFPGNEPLSPFMRSTDIFQTGVFRYRSHWQP